MSIDTQEPIGRLLNGRKMTSVVVEPAPAIPTMSLPSVASVSTDNGSGNLGATASHRDETAISDLGPEAPGSRPARTPSTFAPPAPVTRTRLPTTPASPSTKSTLGPIESRPTAVHVCVRGDNFDQGRRSVAARRQAPTATARYAGRSDDISAAEKSKRVAMPSVGARPKDPIRFRRLFTHPCPGSAVARTDATNNAMQTIIRRAHIAPRCDRSADQTAPTVATELAMPDRAVLKNGSMKTAETVIPSPTYHHQELQNDGSAEIPSTVNNANAGTAVLRRSRTPAPRSCDAERPRRRRSRGVLTNQ